MSDRSWDGSWIAVRESIFFIHINLKSTYRAHLLFSIGKRTRDVYHGAYEREAWRLCHMIRKTMRIGEIRTSIKLENEFWDYLKTVATQRHLRLSGLVNEVATASPDRTNLASTLRTYALVHARLRTEAIQREMDKLALAGNTQDLARVLEACPLPALTMDGERAIRQYNRAFALWLNLDGKATIGQRLDNIMILRGPGMRDMWTSLLDGRLARAGFNATYVSPGKVRTAQAIAVALSAPTTEPDKRGCVVLFETLAGRS